MREHPNTTCPLCLSSSTNLFFEKREKKWGLRQYDKCPSCSLVFLHPTQRLEPDLEKIIYDQHENSPDHQGYVAFLKQLTDPLEKLLGKKKKGLDFGCGPGPAIPSILNSHTVCCYDPIYLNNPGLLVEQYDFITCTEVIEHIFNPARKFSLLNHLLKKEVGLLAIMTQVLRDESTFPDWWYHRDPTHVCFYQPATFEWMANRFEWDIRFFKDNVIIFQT